MGKRVAVYPGTFDPITLGHLDVMRAASDIFDEVAVGILVNPRKQPMFPEKTRLEMIEEVIRDAGLDNVRVVVSAGLTVEFAEKEKAIAIVRGLRLVMDYEAELDMSFNSRVLADSIYTVFIAPNQEHIHIRSSTVRELIHFGIGEKAKDKLSLYVPEAVIRHIEQI